MDGWQKNAIGYFRNLPQSNSLFPSVCYQSECEIHWVMMVKLFATLLIKKPKAKSAHHHEIKWVVTNGYCQKIGNIHNPQCGFYWFLIGFELCFNCGFIGWFGIKSSVDFLLFYCRFTGLWFVSGVVIPLYLVLIGFGRHF